MIWPTSCAWTSWTISVQKPLAGPPTKVLSGCSGLKEPVIGALRSGVARAWRSRSGTHRRTAPAIRSSSSGPSRSHRRWARVARLGVVVGALVAIGGERHRPAAGRDQEEREVPVVRVRDPDAHGMERRDHAVLRPALELRHLGDRPAKDAAGLRAMGRRRTVGNGDRRAHALNEAPPASSSPLRTTAARRVRTQRNPGRRSDQTAAALLDHRNSLPFPWLFR